MLDLAAISQVTNDEKDLESLVLRQQLRLVERKQERGRQIPHWQKMIQFIPLIQVSPGADSPISPPIRARLRWMNPDKQWDF